MLLESASEEDIRITMKLQTLAVLFTIPALLLAQQPIAPGDETRVNATGAAADSPSDSASDSPAPGLDPLTPGQKAKRRVLRLVEPVTLFSSAFGAGIEQWRNVPPEWGQGSEAYAIRFASAEGFTAAHNAVALGFDIAFHLDPRYRRLPQAGFRQRLWNAVSQTVIANKDSGGKTINVSEIAGNFSAGFISNTWEPAGYNSTGDALTRGALGLAYNAAKNIFREFLPDLLHPGKRSSENGR
jgi:hypothetical protein